MVGRAVLAAVLGCALAILMPLAACGESKDRQFELGAEDQKAADELAVQLEGDYKQRFGLDDDEIQCLAEGHVAPSDRLDRLNSTPWPAEAERTAWATEVVDMQIGCTDRWGLMFVIWYAPRGFDAISDASRSCVVETFDDEQARLMWISEVSGEHTPDLDGRLLAALRGCLPAEELNMLDLGT